MIMKFIYVTQIVQDFREEMGGGLFSAQIKIGKENIFPQIGWLKSYQK